MDIEASVEMPTGKMQGLPPPPTTQEEVHRSPFRKAFEHSQKVELSGLCWKDCFGVEAGTVVVNTLYYQEEDNGV